MNISAPAKNEYPEYHAAYIGKVTGNDLLAALRDSENELVKFIQTIPAEKFDYRYAAGKWTIKEVLQHIIDAERIFAYRALRFARNDKTELPGFDESEYTPESNAVNRAIDSLLKEYSTVREATVMLFDSFTDEMLNRSGIASGKKVTVRAIGFIIAGHNIHHHQVIKDRYLT